MTSLDYLEKQLAFLKEELQKLDVSQQQVVVERKRNQVVGALGAYKSYKSSKSNLYVNDFYSKVLVPAKKNLTHRLCGTNKEGVKAIRMDGDGNESELKPTTDNTSTGYPADNPPSNAFDEKYRHAGWSKSTKSVLYAPNTDWLGYKFKIEYGGEAWTHQNGGFFNGLWLVSGNDAPERDPVKFRVFGSAVENGDYEEIVTETDLPKFNLRRQSMLIAMPKAHEKHYLYYKVLFKTAPAGSSGFQSFQLAEMSITALNYWDELKHWMDKSEKSIVGDLRERQLAFLIEKSGIAPNAKTLEKKLEKMVEVFGAMGFPTK